MYFIEMLNPLSFKTGSYGLFARFSYYCDWQLSNNGWGSFGLDSLYKDLLLLACESIFHSIGS